MDYLEEEKKIVKYMLNFLSENINKRDDFVFKRRLYDYIYKLCMVEAKKLNYKVEVHYNINQIECDNIILGEDVGVMHLIFDDLISESDLCLGCYGRNLDFKYKKPRAPIMVISDAGINYVFNSSKLNAENSCIDILNNLFHELRHMQQDFYARKNMSSNIGLLYVKNLYVKSLFQENNYYNLSLIERDANIEAIKNVKKIYGDISKYNYYFNHKFTMNYFNNVQIDEYISNKFDQIIKKIDLDKLFLMFPILKKEYNIDGKRKNIISLYDNMNDEINNVINDVNLNEEEKRRKIYNCREFYFEIMFRFISDNKNYESYSQHPLFNEMIEFFLEKGIKEKQDTIDFVMKDYVDMYFRNKYYQNNIDVIEKSIKYLDKKNILKNKVYRKIYEKHLKNTSL